MGSVRAAYMMTDMEGVAGVDDWDPRHFEYANQAKGISLVQLAIVRVLRLPVIWGDQASEAG